MASQDAMEQSIDRMASEIAHSTGVDPAAVTKVLLDLGVEKLIENIVHSTDADRLATVTAGDLRIAARLSRSTVHI